jgi:hypothetical protein
LVARGDSIAGGGFDTGRPNLLLLRPNFQADYLLFSLPLLVAFQPFKAKSAIVLGKGSGSFLFESRRARQTNQALSIVVG